MKITKADRKKFRVRNKIKKVSSNDRYRLSVNRSVKNISVQIIDDTKNITILSASSNTKKIDDTTKRLWGMNRSLINNAIIGSSVGFEKILELSGVGYRAALKGKQLNLQLGFSHDINFDIPEDVKILVEKQTTIKISGVDKQNVGMIASKIKSFRPPEHYKGKGIKEKGQYILRKEGKKK